MARSMTGYGRGQKSFDELNITVELKSVNHRYLEVSSKVPRECLFLEEKLKSYIQSRVARGKIDIFVTINTAALGETVVEINRTFAEPYIAALKSLVSEYGLTDDVTAASVARNPDVLKISKSLIDEEGVWEKVKSAATDAVEAFVTMRTVEGGRLKEDIISRVAVIKNLLAFIEEQSPKTVVAYREKLEQRMRDLLGDVNIDEQRLLTETGIIADKLAVCEETVRLNSHMEQLCSLLDDDEPIGRKLDFIVQEMNRETNTIGSKAQDLEIARAVVDIKSEIEKIREQVQNIE